MTIFHVIVAIFLVIYFTFCPAFRVLRFQPPLTTQIRAKRGDIEEKYFNPVAAALSNFISKEPEIIVDSLDKINWNARKRKKTSLETLRKDLDKVVSRNQFFVTGMVEPSLYSNNFSFSDPDVAIKGIQEYARGVAKIFSAGTTAELISSEVSDVTEGIITITWRLEGRVNIGAGLPIKGFVVYSDFCVGTDGLIYFQKDRFSLSGIDILMSAFFPFLNGVVTAAPAPPVEELRRKAAQS